MGRYSEFFPHDGEAPIILPIGATDEFGTLQVASINGANDVQEILHSIDPSLTDEDYIAALVNLQQMADPADQAQSMLIDTCKKRGVHLVYPHKKSGKLESPVRHSLDIYCRDWIGVIDDIAIFTKLENDRNDLRSDYRAIFERLPGNKRYEIDDVLPWGNVLLHQDAVLIGTFDIGKQMYTQQQVALFTHGFFSEVDSMIRAKQQLQRILHETKSTRKLIEIEMTKYSHLDLAITPLPKKSPGAKSVVLASPLVSPKGLSTLRTIYDEVIECRESIAQSAYNVLWLDPETPVVNAQSQHVQHILRMARFNVLPLSLASIIASLGNDPIAVAGGWRCMVGPLQRANDYIA